MEPLLELRDRIEAEADTHAAGEDRPLGGYAALLSTYAVVVMFLTTLVRRRKLPVPQRPYTRDLVMISIATHKPSRMISKDSVLAATPSSNRPASAPLRAAIGPACGAAGQRPCRCRAA